MTIYDGREFDSGCKASFMLKRGGFGVAIIKRINRHQLLHRITIEQQLQTAIDYIAKKISASNFYHRNLFWSGHDSLVFVISNGITADEPK